MESILSVLLGLLLLVVLPAIYFGSAAWAVTDARKRGYSGGIVVLLMWLFGPFGAIAWALFRPADRLSQPQNQQTFDTAEDQIEVAAQLESLGDWDASIKRYEQAAQDWPEHAAYIRRCIEEIKKKQAMAGTQ